MGVFCWKKLWKGVKMMVYSRKLLIIQKKIKGKYQWEVEKKDGPCKNDIEKLTL